MVWTNLAILGIGFGIGVVSGWQMRRSQSKGENVRAAQGGRGLAVERATEERLVETRLSEIEQSKTKQSEIEQSEIKQQYKAQLQQLQLAACMAQEMAQFKAGFLARTSHELRSPINSVISLHQLILSDLCENPEEEREFVAQASTAAQKMLALLDQLIKVSKATYGTEELRIQPISIEDTLMEVQQFVILQAKNRNIRLEMEYPEPDFEVYADRNWIRQVILSLIDMPLAQMQEGIVTVKTQTNVSQKEAYIYIEDERPAEFWSDAVDLITSLKANENPFISDGKLNREAIDARMEEINALPSPSLTLLINQTLLAMMQGRLELLAFPSNSESDFRMTQIRCTLPLVVSA